MPETRTIYHVMRLDPNAETLLQDQVVAVYRWRWLARLVRWLLNLGNEPAQQLYYWTRFETTGIKTKVTAPDLGPWWWRR